MNPSKKPKVLFLDRDGTLVIEPPVDNQLDSLEKLEFYPGVFQYLARIAKELDYLLVMVTNQDGLGTSSFPEETFWPAQEKIIQAFANEGIHFSDILIDRSFPEENLSTRKPGTGLLTSYLQGDYNLAESFVIGDRATDTQLARNLGCRSIFIGEKETEGAVLTTTSWQDIYLFLKNLPRTTVVERNTNETKIRVELNLDGQGTARVKTGLGFFDHMLEQIARHGDMNLYIDVAGDLHVDEHHTIEDVGLALGQAFSEALGNKAGIERYGFVLPMDDCLAQVAIDFGGRPWIIWQAKFKREKIGDMPTEMFFHFFKSFTDNARCNLFIKADGHNEHHKIESIFKAFAKTLRAAVTRTGKNQIPSTKGVL